MPEVQASDLAKGPHAELYKPVLAALATVQDTLGQAEVGAQLLKREVEDFNQARLEMFKAECEKRGLQYCGRGGHLVHASPGEMVLVYELGTYYHDGGSYGSDHEYPTYTVFRTCPDCHRKCLEEAAARTDTRVYQAKPDGNGNYEYLSGDRWSAVESTDRRFYVHVEPVYLEEWEEELGLPPLLTSNFRGDVSLYLESDANRHEHKGYIVDDSVEVGTELG